MCCMTDIRSVYSQKNLHKLALPICIFRENGRSDSSQTSESDDIIRVVVETCPNIEEFEFTPCFRCVSPLCGLENKDIGSISGIIIYAVFKMGKTSSDQTGGAEVHSVWELFHADFQVM